MKATIKAVLWTKKPRVDGTLTIKIRVTIKRNARFIALPFSICKSDWNERTNRVRATHPQADTINKEIERVELELRKNYQVAETYSPLEELRKRQSEIFKLVSFLDYTKKHIELLHGLRKFGTKKKYRTLLNKLNAFVGQGKDLYFHEIDSDFLNKFQVFLLNSGVRPNGIITYFKGFRKLFYQAITAEVFMVVKNPFDFYTPLEETTVPLRHLSKDQVNQITRLKLSKDAPLFHTKNQFLFQIFANGLRVSDLGLLRWRHFNEKNIALIMHKTRTPLQIPYGKNIFFLLRHYTGFSYTEFEKHLEQYGHKPYDMNKEDELFWDMVVKEFEANVKNDFLKLSRDPIKKHEFVFPMLTKKDFQIEYSELTLKENQLMDSKHSIYNKNLKKLAVLADIHLPLSSHYARHTSAHIKLINGEDIYDIKQSLGQTDLATTERYVERFDQPRLEQVNKRTDNFIPLYYSC